MFTSDLLALCVQMGLTSTSWVALPVSSRVRRKGKVPNTILKKKGYAKKGIILKSQTSPIVKIKSITTPQIYNFL